MINRIRCTFSSRSEWLCLPLLPFVSILTFLVFPYLSRFRQGAIHIEEDEYRFFRVIEGGHLRTEATVM